MESATKQKQQEQQKPPEVKGQSEAVGGILNRKVRDILRRRLWADRQSVVLYVLHSHELNLCESGSVGQTAGTSINTRFICSGSAEES